MPTSDIWTRSLTRVRPTKRYHRRARTLVLCVLIASALSACTVPAPHEVWEATEQIIRPQAGEGIALTSSVAPSTPPELRSDSLLRAPLPPVYVVLGVHTFDLDTDGTVEQLVVVKRPSTDNRIRLVVIDYDRERNSYLRTWEGATHATEVGSFQIEAIELTGDNYPEIIGRGINDQGEQTMDIFRFTTIERDSTINLVPVGAFNSHLSVRIELESPFPSEIRRYPRLPVVVTERQMGDEELEFEQLFFQWSAATERFTEVLKKTIEDGTINRELFEKLRAISEEDFLRLIHGIWERVADNTDAPHEARTAAHQKAVRDVSDRPGYTVAEFNADSRMLNFNQEFSLESFRATNPEKTVREGYPTIQLSLINDALETLTHRAYITFRSQNTIEITVSSSDDYSGVYHRYQGADTVGEKPYTLIDGELLLDGWYHGSFNGVPLSLHFDGSRITVRTDAGERHGSWLLYDTGVLIMEINLYDQNRRYTDQQSYIANYSQLQREDDSEDVIVRSVRLVPAVINAGGIEVGEGAEINLRQRN